MRLPVLISAMLLFGSGAHAKTVEECCQHAAAQHGYSGGAAACYASVCQQYVSMEPDGRKCAAHGRGFTAYRAALQQSCGISH